MIARAPRAERDRAMLGRGALFLTETFVSREIVPRAGIGEKLEEWSVEIARVTPTRLTLRYTFNNRTIVYGKAYQGDLGPTKYRSVSPVTAFQTIRSLWENGFGPAGHNHVPEPLAFLEEENMILMGPAGGSPLDRLLREQSIDDAVQSARSAARWLWALHSSHFVPLATESHCERIKVLKELDAVSRSAAEHPSQARSLVKLLRQVRGMSPSSRMPLTFSPVHGQYSLGTVFLDGIDVTAIDLDNVTLSDPATDVARFVSKVKWSRLFGGLEDPAGAQRVAAAFLEEYGKGGAISLPSLPYYTALYCLKEYAKFTLKADPGDPQRERAEALCRSEIQQCKQGLSRRRRVLAGDEAADQLDRITNPEFLAQSIGPLAPSGGVGDKCNVTTVRDKGNGRLTLRYEIAGDLFLYGKCYNDVRGRRLRVLQALWDGGFNDSSPYRVPQVLACFPEHNLFVMAAAQGTALSGILAGDDESASIAGIRQAARWLAALHGSSIRIGAPEAEWDSFRLFRLAERFTQSCAGFPEHLSTLLDLLYWLRHELDHLPEGRPIVQAHGSYNPGHIFVAPDAATAIDLDRSRAADPAKDVAEFLSALCSAGFRLGWDGGRLDRFADAFLEEYGAHAAAPVSGLPYYRSAYTALSLCGALRKLGPDEGTAGEMVRYYMRTLDRTFAARHA